MRFAYLMAAMALMLMIPGVYAQPEEYYYADGNYYFCCYVYNYFTAYFSGTWTSDPDDDVAWYTCNDYCYYDSLNTPYPYSYACTYCDLATFRNDCEGTYGYQYSSSNCGDDTPTPSVSFDFDSTCDGNVVTVDGGGNDAHVVVKEGGEIAAAGDTQGGVFTFDGCGMDDVTVKVTQSGHKPKELSVSIIDCAQCGAGPVCEVDADCATNEKCVNEDCVPVECPCGQVQNHQCNEYECCSDADCAEGLNCEAHECVEPEGCKSDADCGMSQFCDIPAGAPVGTCEEVTGDCGVAENHVFVPYNYECGSEPGCPSCEQGFDCVNHACVQSDLSCPTTGIVGDSKTCEAKENGQPCTNCDYVVTDPTGRESTGRTDENGNLDLPLNIEGTYKVALLKDGQVVKIIEVKAFPQAQPEVPEKPTTAGDDPMGMLLALLILLLLVAAGIVYWRSRGQKRR